jgi:CMP-N-acetylneuraminic acid synthetase
VKLAIQVPIKGKSSQRVPNKNFRDLNGKPLCHWLLDELVQLPQDIHIYIDSEDVEVFQNLSIPAYSRFQYHTRESWFAEDHANGNHLLHQFALMHPQYDAYVQLFVTAVTLHHGVIKEAISAFQKNVEKHDSLFLVTEDTGWIWHEGKAMNYDPSKPNGLPRSQDATYYKETTGMYMITRQAALQTGCRIGEKPLPYPVSPEYALDIDTMSDLKEAERLLRFQENS